MTGASHTRVALSGFGSVGRGFASILVENPDLPIQITVVVDRGGYSLSADGLNPMELLGAKRAGSVARHPSGRAVPFDRAALEESGAKVLVEAASTSFLDGQPGWDYVQMALNTGLDVVLASKGPLVAHWDELYRLASENGSHVGISATHGAPLPVLDLVRFGMSGSRLKSVRALFNSTTGLLLEEMEKSRSLDEAVRVAVEAGVAETDPRLDVEGWDAAAKCVIVGRSLFGGGLQLEDVDRTGIENLTTSEVMEAAEAGTPIKLLCCIEPGHSGAVASVRPSRLASDDPLSTLRAGALGVVYDVEPMGSLFLAAYGAGGVPTAAAVIRDILNLRSI